MNPFVTVSLVGGPAWEVSGSRDLSLMFGAIEALVPELTRMHLNASAMANEVRDALAPFSEPSESPDLVSLRVSQELFAVLSRLADTHAEPEMCFGMIGMAGSNRVLEWFDIPDDPVYIDLSISAGRVSQVTKEFSLAYKLLRGNA